MASPAATDEVTPAKPPVPLSAIFLAFLQLGAVSFGGGLSAWVYREVIRRGWMEEEEFLAGLGLSQVLPGANISNLTVYVGSRLRGLPGALAGLAGLVFIPFFSVIGLLLLYQRIVEHGLLQAALDGVAAAAVGLMILMAWKAGRRSSRSVAGTLVLAATFLLVGVLEWPLIPVVACLAPISIAAAWPRD
jgi:chromate transporter